MPGKPTLRGISRNVLHHARRTLLPSGLESGVVVDTDGARIRSVRRARPGDPPAEPGLLIPGLVNAHLHLELSWAAGRVPGGEGLPAWIRDLMRIPRPPAGPELAAAAGSLVASGTALVCDIANGDTAAILDEHGLVGIVQHEVLGFGAAQLPDRVAAVAGPDRTVGRVVVRPSPHAIYSTPPALIRAACRPSSVPASIHVGEDPAERSFSELGAGSFAELLDALGVDWRWWTPPGLRPVAYLDSLSVLGPGLLLVHGVDLDDDDRARIAARGSPLCLCPRSNLHIGGRLPDVPALLAAGVHPCLGTDSLGSSPDLDVLAELGVLARAFPEVPIALLLHLATTGGADALGFPELGRIAVGASPGLVLLDTDDPRDLADGPVPRTWKVRP